MANLAVWIAVAAGGGRPYARLNFLDIGQGDAAYLRTAEGNDVLIDGGPGDAVLSKLGKFMPFWDRSIEFLILTHPHADHVGGLVDVLQRYHVAAVLISEVTYNSATYRSFLDLLREKHISVVVPHLGQRIFLDRSTVFDVYYPVVKDFVTLPGDINDVSVVGKLSFGKSHVLFAGDAGKDIESLLLSFQLPLGSEILKVGHHGSRHSTSPEFLKAVGPRESVISVGKNSYGHPHPEVLGLLAEDRTEILRTDQRGDISFRIYPDRIVSGR